jgi:hypothetical protein
MVHAERGIEAIDSRGLSDVILPSQYFDAMGGGGLCSEGRLMLAVLVDAINVLRGGNRMSSARRRQVFAEAAHWVNMKGTQAPFSFDSVCETVGIDSDMARECLGGLTAGRTGTDRLGVRLRLKELSRAQRMTANRLRPHRSAHFAVVK